MIALLSDICSVAAMQLGSYGCWSEQFEIRRHVECLQGLSYFCLYQ